jgi:hypothetical protein
LIANLLGSSDTSGRRVSRLSLPKGTTPVGEVKVNIANLERVFDLG